MTATAAVPFTSTPLTSGWTFKQGDVSSVNEYLPANDLPTEVHCDLLRNGKIADPFEDLNELSVRWIGDETWTYHTMFATPVDYGKPGVVNFLRFEGLDTFASVYLNEELVVRSENMFLGYRVNLAGRLKPTENELVIVFESSRKKGLELVQEHQKHKFIVHQTEISRGPVRKAQYHWGWDWGPILLTCGPWRPISIESYTHRLEDVRVRYKLAPDMKSAKVTASVVYEGLGVTFTISNKKTGEIIASSNVEVRHDGRGWIATTDFALEDIELWWPRGYGVQALYIIRVDANLSKESAKSLHTVSQTFGFRRVELVKEPDSHGTSFYFRINNVDIFIGGSCWIPADSFLTCVTPEKYRSWVQIVAQGNQSMLRVWGGGIYELDAFYDAADEMGILIWQDFAFACASYPTYSEYLISVEAEAVENLRRLRNHPSLVIWAGNNEDYQLVERYGLEYDIDDQDPQSWLKTNFPARYIYEHLLPEIIKAECPEIPYHPSSPFGNGKSTTLKVDSTIGDVHQWNVWHGTMEPYQKFPEMGGRFVSEFGMEAYPHASTLKQWITRAEDCYPGSMAMDFRNKAAGHEHRLVSYVAENFRIRYDHEGFTHLTQVMQADAMSWAYKAWRRQWGTSGERKCGGVLVWQLNDCWPTISWAVVDYHLVPKPAYYVIKRTMEPLTVGIQRKFRPWTMRPADELWQRDTGHVDMRELWRNAEFDVWIANSMMEELRGEVVIRCWSIKYGTRIRTISKTNITINPNGTTEILKNHILVQNEQRSLNEPFDLSKADPFVVQAALFVDDECVGSDTAWPDPIKYLTFDERHVEFRYSNDKTRAFVSAALPVKGFVFSEREGVKLSDNGFDIMPGDTKEVVVTGCAADELKWMYVGMR